MALHETEAANQDTEPAKDPGPGKAANNPTIATGDAREVAALLAAHPEQRDALIRALHTQRGNAFVGQVLAASTSAVGPVNAKAKARADREDDDGSGIAGPSGGRFTGDGKLGQVERDVTDLKLGDSGPAVRKLQVALAELNFRPLEVTGTFDAPTKTQLAAYQTSRKLGRTDGELDQATFMQLEREFTADHYAHMAQHAPPGMSGTPKPKDGDKPSPVMLSETHKLSPEEAAEAGDVLSPAKNGQRDSKEKFHESVGEGMANMYGPKILKALQHKIDEKYKDASSTKSQHDDGDVYSMDRIVKVGGAAKIEADKVFGSWATGPEMKADVNVFDRFTKDRAKQAGMPPDKKHDAARHRARYFMNTESIFDDIDAEHHANRTRAQEAGLIDAVLEVIVRDNLEKLLLISATWSASTDREGNIKMQRVKSKSGNDDDRLWNKFGTMVHEYMHSLTHQRWHDYRDEKEKTDPQGAHTLAEGVAEFLTRAVMSQVNASDPKLQEAVVGHTMEDAPDLTRTAYGSAVGRAQALVGVVGASNLYAAYFLGQTQLIGA